ncbi:MAG: 4-(cytidine 5'-diphospho)-2-C-methyl-D-erythritol kinase [Deinococcales bacterium]
MSGRVAVEEQAHAKVNLGLSVLARRGDGYHEIETLMARLSLADEVRVERAGSGVLLSVEGADLPSDERNLATRAALRYLAEAGAEGVGVAVRLRKRIPLAAGLGGGSSDAAAVLRALRVLVPAKVDVQRLGLALGSDVPFFLADLPAALARGRGERLQPVALPPLALVLAYPGEAVSAAEAYRALQSFTSRMPLDALVEKLRSGAEPGFVNALQPGVVRAHPQVREVIKALRAEGLRGVAMSGSGSCCFALAPAEAAAQEAAARLAAAHPSWTVLATRTA